MKKTVLYLFSLLITTIVLSSCASKKGCGLTSDIQKIENSVHTETVLVANAD